LHNQRKVNAGGDSWAHATCKLSMEAREADTARDVSTAVACATPSSQQRRNQRSMLAMITAELLRQSDDEEDDDEEQPSPDGRVLSSLAEADSLMAAAEREFRELLPHA
jgi:hypothetical protein